MAESGQIDTESASALFESTTRPDVVEADSQAAMTGSFGPDSPSGKLGTLFFKLQRHETKKKKIST